MTQITNAPDAQQPFVDKRGFITRAWFQWLLNIISNATTGGTVTHTGTLTAPKLIQGNGGADITVNTTTATVTKLTAGVPSAATAGTDYTALAFKTIAVSGQSDIVADSAADLLTVAAGSGVTLTTNAGTDTLTIAATGTGGTVTNTGTLTSGKLIQGNGGVDVTVNATTATVTKLTAGTPSAASAGTDYVAPGAITTDGITMSTARLLGRTTAATGAVEEITAGTGLTLSAGTLTATGSGGTVTTTGSPASGNLSKFSGATSITNADLTGDVTTAGTVATTLATVNANVGTFGDGTNVAQVTVNAKGLVTAASSVAITNQGTVTHSAGALTSGQLVYGNGSADLKVTAATNGQVPIGKTSDGTAAFATLSAGSGVTITNAANSITIAASGVAGTSAMILIQEQTPSGTGVVTFSSLGSYRSLLITGMGRSTAATTSVVVQVTLNSDTANNYQNERVYGVGNTPSAATAGASEAYIYGADMTADTGPADTASSFQIYIPDYGGTTFNKTTLGEYNLRNGTNFSTNFFRFAVGSFWSSTAAVTRVDLTLSSGNWKAGSRVSCYGLF